MAMITRSKAINQISLVIEDTSSEDSTHLSKLDRVIKTTINDTNKVEILPRKLEPKIRELPFETEHGEFEKESIEGNWEGPEILDVVESPLGRQTRELEDKPYDYWAELKKNQSRHHHSLIIRSLFNIDKDN